MFGSCKSGLSLAPKNGYILQVLKTVSSAYTYAYIDKSILITTFSLAI